MRRGTFGIDVARRRGMPASARSDLLVDLMRRVQRSRVDATERAGALVGLLVAPVLAGASALRRRARALPRGDCADASVAVPEDVPQRYRALAEHLAGRAFVRLSNARTKGARWPDVLGCAVRFGGDADDPAIAGDQDLLFATIRRPWTLPLSPFTTDVDDYFANDYFTVSPFSVPPPAVGSGLGHGIDIGSPPHERLRDRWRVSAPRVWFRLRPASREPDGLVALSSMSTGPISSLRTSTARSMGGPAEQRRRRFERAIASGTALFTLGIAESPWGPFTPLVRLQLVRVHLADPADVRFDPFRNGRGIEPRGFVHALHRNVQGHHPARDRRARAPEHGRAPRSEFGSRSEQPVGWHRGRRLPWRKT